MRKHIIQNSYVFGAVAAVLAVSPVNVVNAATPDRVPAMSACGDVSTGVVTIRKRCRRFEKALSVHDLIAQGPLGPQGQKGETGPKGDTGAKGDTGSVGPQGIQGLTGAVGPVGATGATGATGVMGPAGAMGPQGIQGVQGAVGPQGPMGSQGVPGASAFSPLPSGVTLFGVAGSDFYSSDTDTDWATLIPLHGIPHAAFDNEHVVVKNNTVVDNECGGASCLTNEELTYSGNCNGTFDAPSAPAGWLCIYPASASNAANIRAVAVPSGAGRYGFALRWRAWNVGISSLRAVWAYQEP